jgi:predicted aspartyl protease
MAVDQISTWSTFVLRWMVYGTLRMCAAARAHETLGAGLVLIAVLGGCSTTTPDVDTRLTAFRAAATECASGNPAVKVEEIDADGRVRLTVLQGGQEALSAFTACYNQKASERIARAGRVSSPARILESGSAAESPTAPRSGRITSVPMQTRNNRFLVPVILNEKETATFLLDTGASITVITPDLARRAGIEIAPGGMQSRVRMASGQELQVSVIRLKSIRIGLARIDNIGVALYELGIMDKTAQPPLVVDGLLGADVLGQFTTTIDPEAGRLTLQLRELPRKE